MGGLYGILQPCYAARDIPEELLTLEVVLLALLGSTASHTGGSRVTLVQLLPAINTCQASPEDRQNLGGVFVKIESTARDPTLVFGYCAGFGRRWRSTTTPFLELHAHVCIIQP